MSLSIFSCSINLLQAYIERKYNNGKAQYSSMPPCHLGNDYLNALPTVWVLPECIADNLGYLDQENPKPGEQLCLASPSFIGAT
jgi:hypothetical protein